MAFSEEDQISIKFLRQNKQYSARKFLKEFSQKGWLLGGLNKLITKIDTTGTVARRTGSGRRRTVCTVDNINVEADSAKSRSQSSDIQNKKQIST